MIDSVKTQEQREDIISMAIPQEKLMKFSPATGNLHPYPSHAKQWREYHGRTAWLINPWTGQTRLADDVGSDTFGHLIVTDED